MTKARTALKISKKGKSEKKMNEKGRILWKKTFSRNFTSLRETGTFLFKLNVKETCQPSWEIYLHTSLLGEWDLGLCTGRPKDNVSCSKVGFELVSRLVHAFWGDTVMKPYSYWNWHHQYQQDPPCVYPMNSWFTPLSTWGFSKG